MVCPSALYVQIGCDIFCIRCRSLCQLFTTWLLCRDLSHNSIVELSEGQLSSSISDLDMSQNALTYIGPHALDNLIDLVALYVRHSMLRILMLMTKTIKWAHSHSHTYLWLRIGIHSYCVVCIKLADQKFPCSDLSYNRMSELLDGQLPSTTVDLDMSQNALTYIGPHALDYLPRLQTLYEKGPCQPMPTHLHALGNCTPTLSHRSRHQCWQ